MAFLMMFGGLGPLFYKLCEANSLLKSQDAGTNVPVAANIRSSSTVSPWRPGPRYASGRLGVGLSNFLPGITGLNHPHHGILHPNRYNLNGVLVSEALCYVDTWIPTIE